MMIMMMMTMMMMMIRMMMMMVMMMMIVVMMMIMMTMMMMVMVMLVLMMILFYFTSVNWSTVINRKFSQRAQSETERSTRRHGTSRCVQAAPPLARGHRFGITVAIGSVPVAVQGGKTTARTG